MQIIFSKQVAEQLKEKYIVLELETIDAGNGKFIEAHCVVPGDKIPLTQLPMIEKDIELHNHFVNAIKKRDYRLCAEIAPYLMGKFGGELDSFYEIVSSRYQSTQKD
ncbi:MAG: hypothetical protein N2235_11640 [Fischerella sp.]|nr:hypothetical protein [Fischerella sp.]